MVADTQNDRIAQLAKIVRRMLLGTATVQDVEWFASDIRLSLLVRIGHGVAPWSPANDWEDRQNIALNDTVVEYTTREEFAGKTAFPLLFRAMEKEFGPRCAGTRDSAENYSWILEPADLTLVARLRVHITATYQQRLTGARQPQDREYSRARDRIVHAVKSRRSLAFRYFGKRRVIALVGTQHPTRVMHWDDIERMSRTVPNPGDGRAWMRGVRRALRFEPEVGIRLSDLANEVARRITQTYMEESLSSANPNRNSGASDLILGRPLDLVRDRLCGTFEQLLLAAQAPAIRRARSRGYGEADLTLCRRIAKHLALCSVLGDQWGDPELKPSRKVREVLRDFLRTEAYDARFRSLEGRIAAHWKLLMEWMRRRFPPHFPFGLES